MAVAKPITAPAGPKGVTRRAVLAALPLTAAPLAAQAAEPSAVLRLFRQYRALMDAAAIHVTGAATGPAEDAELDRLFYRPGAAIRAELMATPCATAADFAAKLIVETGNGDYFPDEDDSAIWREARRLTGMPEHG